MTLEAVRPPDINPALFQRVCAWTPPSCAARRRWAREVLLQVLGEEDWTHLAEMQERHATRLELRMMEGMERVLGADSDAAHA